mgnify:CR=1 FL=1
MPKTPFQKIDDVLSDFEKHSPHSDAMTQARIVDYCANRLGKPLMRFVENLFVRYNILFIETSAAPLRNELMYLKEGLLTDIKERFGEDSISKIKIL